MPTRGLWYTKQALNWSFNHTWKEQLENEDKLQQRLQQQKILKKVLKHSWKKENPILKENNMSDLNEQVVASHDATRCILANGLDIRNY